MVHESTPSSSCCTIVHNKPVFGCVSEDQGVRALIANFSSTSLHVSSFSAVAILSKASRIVFWSQSSSRAVNIFILPFCADFTRALTMNRRLLFSAKTFTQSMRFLETATLKAGIDIPAVVNE